MELEIGQSVKGKNFINIIFRPQNLDDHIFLLHLLGEHVGLVAMLEGTKADDGIIQAGLNIPKCV